MSEKLIRSIEEHLNQATKHNITRFPPDFMFQLTVEEFKILKSQIVTSSSGDGTKGWAGYYTRMRQFFLDNEELRKKIEAIEKNLVKKDEEIQTIFKILKELLVQETPPAREPIGFKIPKR